MSDVVQDELGQDTDPSVLDSEQEEVSADSSDSAAPDEGSEAPSPTQTSGRARGPDGKFISATAETQGAEDESAEGSDEPVVEQQTPSVPQGRPVPLKVDGQLYELPGAMQRDDGVIEVAPDGFEHIHRWMGKGIVADQKIAKLQSQLAEATERKTAEAEWVRMVGERYAQIAMLPEEEQLEYLRAFRAEFPSLKAQAEAEHWRQEAERARRANEPDPMQVQAERQQMFAASFDENFQAFLSQPWAKGLTPDDQAQLRRELEAVADSFLYIPQQDDPERGWQKGEWLFNDQKMGAAIKARADYLAQLRTQAAKVTSAAKVNATARAVAPKAPPVGAPKTVTQSKAPVRNNRPMSRDEWLKRNLYR